MAEKVNLVKQAVNAKEYNQVVDSSFKYFVTASTQPTTETVDELFRLYNNLYLQIPVYGSTNSHEYIVKQSSKVYQVDNSADLAPLTAEIADLRQRLLEANEEIQQLSAQLTR
jgi:hypothetical protein